VCLTAVNPATKKPTTLACKTLTVSSNPVGQVQSFTRVGGAVMFTGWAIDPDSTSPVRVDITVNGKPAGYVLANNTSRTQPYLPLWGTTRTFMGRVSAPAGATITLTAENIGPGSATVLGSRKL
jgi:hypothetical protein